MALNLDELMIGDIILNDEGKPCVIEGLFRNQIYTNKGVYLPFEVDPMPIDDHFLVNNGFETKFPYEGFEHKHWYKSSKGYIELYYRLVDTNNYNNYELTRISTNNILCFGGYGESLYVHNLQHLIRESKLNITLTCQQSS